MLVLSRKEGQTIELPELQVVVRVIAVQRSRVQVGIEAPQEITVHRGEVVRKMADQGRLPEALNKALNKALNEEDLPSTEADWSSGQQEQSGHNGEHNGKGVDPKGVDPKDKGGDHNRFPRQEASRVLDELARLEAELSAIAELAEPRSRGIAQRVTADAIQRIEGISRSVRLSFRHPPEMQPIADLVKVRTEVLDRLRERTPPQPMECCD